MPELIALCRIMLAMLESAHYAPEDLLCSKLCRHNLSRPRPHAYIVADFIIEIISDFRQPC